jgi:hypothetical protein
MFDLILSFLADLFSLAPGIGRWKRRMNRRKEWSGTVEAKKAAALSRHAYLVIFRTDDGQTKKLRLDRKDEFALYEEGRRYTKKKGQDLPDAEPAA